MPVPEPSLNHKTAADKIAQKGLSISAVAREIGEDRSHLSNVLSGRRRGGMRLVTKLATFLGVDPYELIAPSESDVRAVVLAMAREYGITPEELATAS